MPFTFSLIQLEADPYAILQADAIAGPGTHVTGEHICASVVGTRRDASADPAAADQVCNVAVSFAGTGGFPPFMPVEHHHTESRAFGHEIGCSSAAPVLCAQRPTIAVLRRGLQQRTPKPGDVVTAKVHHSQHLRLGCPLLHEHSHQHPALTVLP